MTWKRDTRPGNVRTIGDFRIFSEVNSDRETAHVVQFPDGREVRVLPDAAHNGRVRAVAVRGAVYELEQVYGLLEGDQGLLVLLGALSRAGLTWQELHPDLDVTIEEWLAEWLEVGGSAVQLLEELDVDGWAIVRKAEG